MKLTGFWKVGVAFSLGFLTFALISWAGATKARGIFERLGIIRSPKPSPAVDFTAVSRQVLPQGGVELPISWGDLGKRLVAEGVINQGKFEELFAKGDSKPEVGKLLGRVDNGRIRISADNSQLWLDLLWALGLGNKNPVLDEGPINQDPKRTANFASTGGWAGLSVGSPMKHFSRHQFVTLTASQQALLEEVAKGVFRPCCGQSTYFPDCNHGMAMLGALELGVAQGLGKEELFKMALVLNSYWFPQTYLDIATYFAERDIAWGKVRPEEVLGEKFSSGSGYAFIRSTIKSLPKPINGGGSCGA